MYYFMNNTATTQRTLFKKENIIMMVHNKLKHGKKSNFNCVFGWLHDYFKKTLKSMFFEKKILHSGSPSGTLHSKIFKKNVDFSL